MKTAVVICPGRGSYTKAELGYLGRHHSDKLGIRPTKAAETSGNTRIL